MSIPVFENTILKKTIEKYKTVDYAFVIQEDLSTPPQMISFIRDISTLTTFVFII